MPASPLIKVQECVVLSPRPSHTSGLNIGNERETDRQRERERETERDRERPRETDGQTDTD